MLQTTKSGKETNINLREKILPKKIAGKISAVVSSAVKSDILEIGKETSVIGSEKLLFNLLDSTKGNRDIITLNGSKIGKIQSAWTSKIGGKPRKDFGSGSFKIDYNDTAERYEIELITDIEKW